MALSVDSLQATTYGAVVDTIDRHSHVFAAVLKYFFNHLQVSL